MLVVKKTFVLEMVLPQNAEPEQTAFSLLESQSVLTVALNGAGSDSAVVEKTVIPQPVNALAMARWSLFLYQLSSEATEAAKVPQHDRACCATGAIEIRWIDYPFPFQLPG